MEDIFDYNFFDTKNKKRLTKDLENLPSKELIKMINVLIKSQNKTFKILYKNEKSEITRFAPASYQETQWRFRAWRP